MRIDDGRRRDRKTQEYIRKRAVQRFKEGESARELAASFGVNRTTIYDWLEQFEAGGLSALDTHPAPGRERMLSPEQELAVKDMILGKNPRDYGMESALWTRKLVSVLIHDRFGITLGVTVTGELLARLDIVPIKPLRRAYKRDPVAIDHWRASTYPEIMDRAERSKADVVYLDEMGVRSDSPLGYTYGAKGERTSVATPGERNSINAICAVAANGSFWYDVYRHNLNGTQFVEELKKLMRYRRKPLFVILDSHPGHRAKMVRDYVQSCEGKLELHFLPGYAPDLNPAEYVWNHVKSEGPRKVPLRQGESLGESISALLAKLSSEKYTIKNIVCPVVKALPLSDILTIA
jgi:transposase